MPANHGKGRIGRWDFRFRSHRGNAKRLIALSARPANMPQQPILWFEPLEARIMLTAVPAVELDSATITPVAPSSITNPGPVGGYSPSQILQAYGFNLVTFTGPHGQTITGNGAGQTIAIVDAYNDPSITNDLQVFDSQFGLPNTDSTGKFALSVVKEGNYVPADNGWATEISLDVEWTHAIAPGAHILLVEALSASDADLAAAVNYARNVPGVVAVTMSYGESEFSSQTSEDSTYTTPSAHIGGNSGLPGANSLVGGITFFAASGDDGAGVIYPSSSPNVVAVGGTTLTLNGANDYSSEDAWIGSGGGVSSVEPLPAYQKSVADGAQLRLVPDVAYNADPNTGYAIYDSDPDSASGQTGWEIVGGTSASSPQWAALMSIVDQGRALDGKGSLNGVTQTLPAIYNASSTDFHSIIYGTNNDGAGGYPAGPGYNLVDGRGTPVANLLIPYLVQLGTGTVKPVTTTQTTNVSVSIVAIRSLEAHKPKLSRTGTGDSPLDGESGDSGLFSGDGSVAVTTTSASPGDTAPSTSSSAVDDATDTIADANSLPTDDQDSQPASAISFVALEGDSIAAPVGAALIPLTPDQELWTPIDPSESAAADSAAQDGTSAARIEAFAAAWAAGDGQLADLGTGNALSSTPAFNSDNGDAGGSGLSGNSPSLATDA